MFVTTVWTKKVHERRNFWNSNLGVPLLIKIALVGLCFYVVDSSSSWVIQFYGMTSATYC
jgi:hypothetical protein